MALARAKPPLTVSGEEICAVVLAAGFGKRLAPLTSLRPKALCPVGKHTLLDRTLMRLAALGLSGEAAVAVNAHHLYDQVESAVAGRAHISVENAVLGTAGTIGQLKKWIAGRAVLICNSDAYLAGETTQLLADYAGTRPRVLVTHDPARADFGTWQFVGMSLLPPAIAASLTAEPADLYHMVWRDAYVNSNLEFAEFSGVFIDCGTPSDYLAANMHASGGQSVIGPGAIVAGQLIRSVVWPGGIVRADETLVDSIRAGRDITLTAPLTKPRPRLWEIVGYSRG